MGAYVGISFLVVGLFGVMGGNPLPGTVFLLAGFLVCVLSNRRETENAETIREDEKNA